MCPVKSISLFYIFLDCGRKFADDAKLQDHITRRHKV